jgi:hypothetical protein
MALTFFGTDTDLRSIWKLLFDVPGMRVFEDHSVPDQPNRWFNTLDEILSVKNISWHPLAAWPETVGGKPRVKSITFDANTQRKTGAKGRTALLSPALIHVSRNNDQNGCLASATMSCWNEAGARQRSIFPEDFLNEVDWPALRSIMSKAQRQITKSAPAKLRSYPVMPDAFSKLVAGEIMLWNWGEACTFPSPLITLASK